MRNSRVPLEESIDANIQRQIERQLIIEIKTAFFDEHKTVGACCKQFAGRQSPEWIRDVCFHRIHGSVDK